MVTEVKAYQANDGSIHVSQEQALQADALERLKQLGQFNHASALAVVSDAQEIVRILKPLADWRNTNYPKPDNGERLVIEPSVESR